MVSKEGTRNIREACPRFPSSSSWVEDALLKQNAQRSRPAQRFPQTARNAMRGKAAIWYVVACACACRRRPKRPATSRECCRAHPRAKMLLRFIYNRTGNSTVIRRQLDSCMVEFASKAGRQQKEMPQSKAACKMQNAWQPAQQLPQYRAWRMRVRNRR